MQPALFTKIEIDAFFRKHQPKWGTWRRRRKKNKLNVTRVWPLLSLKYYIYRLCVFKIRGFYSNTAVTITFFYATMAIINPLLNNFLALLLRKQFENVKLNKKINKCLCRNRAKMSTMFFSNIAAQHYSNTFIKRDKFE